MAHKPLIDQKFEETQITSSQQESTQFIREIKGINTFPEKSFQEMRETQSDSKRYIHLMNHL